MQAGPRRFATGTRRCGAGLTAARVASAVLGSPGCGSDAKPPGRVLLIGIVMSAGAQWLARASNPLQARTREHS
ncbi:MAG: hypothetical protein OEM05_05595 [Myxococcales bacterium]|nr:hypothetical protein [Myxococcales bacterium]